MKYAADFRFAAREALRGKWLLAVAAGLIAYVLGGLGSEGPEVKFNIDLSGINLGVELAGYQIFNTNGTLSAGTGIVLSGIAVIIILMAVVMAVIYFVVGSVIEAGYARFNLDLVDRMDVQIKSLFAYFGRWKTMAAARFLRSLYTLLWTLLFIIPGIMAAYSYAMTGYILAEQPELTASEAIARSKEMMYGNRIRLFCLQFSFIGWSILCAFTFGIGNLWLRPYKQAATAAFYREISGQNM